MALSSQLVDVIFGRMLARYGQAWLAKWAQVPLNAVRADWAEQLEGFGVIAVNHGLMNLPEDYVPNAAQFRKLCLGRPEPMPLAIEGPKPDPVRVAELLAQAQAQLAARTAKPLQWAYDLQEREKRSEDLTPAQRQAWRDALTTQSAVDILCFRNIDPECLPPAMRPAARPDHAAMRIEDYT